MAWKPEDEREMLRDKFAGGVRLFVHEKFINVDRMHFNFNGKRELIMLWERTLGLNVDLFGDIISESSILEGMLSSNK